MISLKEPLWWEIIIKNLYSRMSWNDILVWMIPFLADAFVFLYPIYLVFLFILWIIKKRFYFQSSALFVFFSSLLSVLVNIFIQFFVEKSRPNIVLWFSDLKTETILHKFLPSSSFPSDHAALWLAFASAVFFWWLKNKDKKFIFLWILFYMFAIIMNFSRVSSWVHRPTDVIAWSIVWIFITFLLFYTDLFSCFNNKINKNLVNLFNRIFRIKN